MFQEAILIVAGECVAPGRVSAVFATDAPVLSGGCLGGLVHTQMARAIRTRSTAKTRIPPTPLPLPLPLRRATRIPLRQWTFRTVPFYQLGESTRQRHLCPQRMSGPARCLHEVSQS